MTEQQIPNEVTILEGLIDSRRSVRLFDSTPVPEHVIQHSLDLALKAPNSSNLQPWEFYWVRDAAKKAELVKACLSQPAAATAQELIVCIARTGSWRQASRDMLKQLEAHEAQGTRIPKAAFHYYRKLVPMMYMQGFLSLIGYFKRAAFFTIGFSRPIMREPTSRSQMETWAVKSCALACENFMLAVRAYGFDTCPMEGHDSLRIRKLLKLPSDAVITMVLSVGRRRPNGVTLPRIRGRRALFVKVI
jgi:nitroreductase